MKKSVALLMVLSLCSCVYGASNEASPCSDTAQGGWEMVWNDEFEIDGLPDSRKWDYEEGFIRNKEEQYYTRERAENVVCRNGRLMITARCETYPNPKYKPGSKYWSQSRKNATITSGSINTFGKAAWQYGRVEVSAKLPKGKGVWPAIWMMGTDRDRVGHPRCGEIDIMEYVNASPETVYATIHYPDTRKASGRASRSGNLKDSSLAEAFHLYALEWNAQKMRFFFDERLILETDISDPALPFHKPFYLLLNFAVGGGWGGEVDPTIFPQQYEIDYVRVYAPARKKN